ncbi:FxLYD domain-containing protein [Streptomyces cyaneofuscatus]|uniref:FxLYD domain-containing protein n=1 Tax=Streptomyces cyaneofuscatus TaxID=66883 RepID=A0ABZ1F3P5_9ACTN|nr:FxLYD domain-containing protein [Streptomyces cyaneofuscatus]WSB11035.1 FxLYD domain-containing protein [Streptomyces cyaneofuscatus]WSD45432.1 FxLYD domain-containing protein [Streptomyces cyaneofuscatus]
MSDNSPPSPPEQPQPQPSPSPWAPPATPPGKPQRTGLIVSLAVGGGLVVAGALVALVYSLLDSASDSIALPPARSDAPYSDPYDEEPYDEEPVDEAPVEEEPEPVVSGSAAERDVTITKCARDSLIGWQHADLTIVNGSGSPAGYVVFVEFLDAKGSVLTDGIATTDDLAPGASVKVKAQGVGEVPTGTKCRVKQVTRDAM